MNLQAKLEQSLNDVLRTAGYIYEVMNNNKRLSNLISGPNTQPINPAIAAQLSSSLYRFDDVLDETIGKFNDARWCVEQMLESKQRQEDSKQQELKREEERTKQAQEQEEARKLKSQQQEKFKEEKARQIRENQEAESKRALELEAERQQKQMQKQQQQQQQKQHHQQQQPQQQQQKLEQDTHKQDQFKKTSPDQWPQSSPQDQLQQIYRHAQMQNQSNDISAAAPVGQKLQAETYSSPSFNFGMNFEPQNDAMLDPSNLISSIPYDEPDIPEMHPTETGKTAPAQPQDMDLDMDNLLGNDELILDGLNMEMLDQGYDINNNTAAIDADFDVDSFLNQYGGE